MCAAATIVSLVRLSDGAIVQTVALPPLLGAPTKTLMSSDGTVVVLDIHNNAAAFVSLH